MDAAHEPVIVLLIEALVESANASGAVVIDGGTDVGIMRLAGRARAQSQVPAPALIGVAVERLVTWPSGPLGDGLSDLEPHHTHFVLVQGKEWGDESETLAAAAGLVAGPKPSVTVLVNGGDTSVTDAVHSVRDGRQVIVVQGTGRAADSLASVAEGRDAESGPMHELASSGMLRILNISVGPEAIAVEVKRLLSREN
jgi:hypothetical protein